MARLANSSVSKKTSIEQLEADMKSQEHAIKQTQAETIRPKKSNKTKKQEKPKTERQTNINNIGNIATNSENENNEEEIKDIYEAQKVFGKGFSPDEYQQMMEVYNTYLPSYPLKTANHKMALIKVCKCTMRYNQALADNDTEAIKLWDNALSKALKEAKINPEQLDAADLTEGITSISQLIMAVEKAKEPIGILPHLISHPQDGADYIIWQIVNYCRKVKSLPVCEYKDIYNFLNEQYEANKDSLPFLVRNVNGKYDETEDNF